MAKRKKKKKSRGLLYFVLAVVLACVGYGPLTRALHVDPVRELPAVVEELRQHLPELPAGDATAAAEDLKDGDFLLPAPLKSAPEKILVRRGYTVSYNMEHNLPNWVAWELTPEKLVERESRTDKFLPDPRCKSPST